MARIVVNVMFCKGCGLCVDVCPQDIIRLNNEIITQKGYHPAMCVDDSACTGCISCALMCPDAAITVER